MMQHQIGHSGGYWQTIQPVRIGSTGHDRFARRSSWASALDRGHPSGNLFTASVRGFTLLELLVVMAVIAILAGILYPVAGMIQRRAAKSDTQALLAQVLAATKTYQSDRGRWPVHPGWGRGSTPAGVDKAKVANALLTAELVGTAPDHRDRPRPGYLVGILSDRRVVDGCIVDRYGTPLVWYGMTASGVWPDMPPFEGFRKELELWSSGPDEGFDDLRISQPGAPGDADADNIPAVDYLPGMWP